MRIRPLERGDLGALLALYMHLHADDAPLPQRAVVDAVWTELITSPQCRCLGGFADEALVASCMLTVVPNLTRGCRPYGVIENVVTHTSHRRKGYGKAILREALSIAWSRNCYKVMLLTGRRDEATLRFYESAGFDKHSKQAFIARPAG